MDLPGFLRLTGTADYWPRTLPAAGESGTEKTLRGHPAIDFGRTDNAIPYNRFMLKTFCNSGKKKL